LSLLLRAGDVHLGGCYLDEDHPRSLYLELHEARELAQNRPLEIDIFVSRYALVVMHTTVGLVLPSALFLALSHDWVFAWMGSVEPYMILECALSAESPVVVFLLCLRFVLCRFYHVLVVYMFHVLHIVCIQ